MTRPAGRHSDAPVTLAEAAIILGVPRSTLYRWAADPEYGVAPVHTMRGTTKRGTVGVYTLLEVAGMVEFNRRRHAAARVRD